MRRMQARSRRANKENEILKILLREVVTDRALGDSKDRFVFLERAEEILACCWLSRSTATDAMEQSSLAESVWWARNKWTLRGDFSQ